VEYRILLPDGSIRHVHEVVYPVSNDSGEAMERYGVVMDVTERKQAGEGSWCGTKPVPESKKLRECR
jgi:hypothetical protein